ncbi:MAG: hypothetical protein IPQ09_25405 [Myxococcales bacterium]|nr:hypothetical protein [Myxococcales bacterium]HQY60623.1 hypothetical protein [Polyangiaceae bacterium]
MSPTIAEFLAVIAAAPREEETEWERAALAEVDPTAPGIPHAEIVRKLEERRRAESAAE